MMENRKTQSGAQEFLTVLGIASAVAGTLTLLALVPPVSIFYRWLKDRDMPYVWTALMTGAVSGVLSFYQTKQEELETAVTEE